MRSFLPITFILCLVSSAAEASTVKALSLAGLVEHSDAIVLGTATDMKTHLDSSGNIVRSVGFTVDEYIDGQGARRITIRLQGGELNGIGRKVPGETDLVLGVSTLLFIERLPNEDNAIFVVVGMGQGRFAVTADRRTGERFVTRTLEGISLLGEVREDAFGLGRSDTSTFILFETFVSAIRKLAAK